MENFVLQLNKPPGSPHNKAARKMVVHAFMNAELPEVLALKPTIAELEAHFTSNVKRERVVNAWNLLSPEEQEDRRRQRRRKERQRAVCISISLELDALSHGILSHFAAVLSSSCDCKTPP